jgi:hypothetical protein
VVLVKHTKYFRGEFIVAELVVELGLRARVCTRKMKGRRKGELVINVRLLENKEAWRTIVGEG